MSLEKISSANVCRALQHVVSIQGRLNIVWRGKLLSIVCRLHLYNYVLFFFFFFMYI